MQNLIEIEIEIIYLPKKGRRPPQIARANQGGDHQKKYNKIKIISISEEKIKKKKINK